MKLIYLKKIQTLRHGPGPRTGHGAVTGTSRQNGALVPRIGLTMIRVETLKMEQNAGSVNIRLKVSLRFHTMGLVPAYCGETRNRARPKTELLLSQKRIPAADFVSMQC